MQMQTPRLKQVEGEEILHKVGGIRRKGLFGTRFGELVVTNQRVAFVKAWMRGPLPLAAIAGVAGGVKPLVAFDRAAITTVTVEPWKKTTSLVIGDGTRSERFGGLDADEIAQVVSVLRPS